MTPDQVIQASIAGLQYRPAHSRAHVASALLGITSGTSLWLNTSLWSKSDLSYFDPVLLVSIELMLFSVTAISFIYWMYRAIQNSAPLNESNRLYVPITPSQAIWCWYVPIFAPILPYITMKTIWRASLSEYEMANDRVKYRLLTIWWAIWISHGVLFAVSVTSSPLIVSQSAVVLRSISGVLSIVIIYMITVAQERKYKSHLRVQQRSTDSTGETT